MDRLRTPFLIAAFIVILVATLIDVGSIAWVGGENTGVDLPTPGIGIPYLALVDGIVLFTIGMFVAALIVPAKLLGTIQGIITLILSLLLVLGTIVLIFVALAKLILMVTLLLAVPFGTIAYLAAYAHFDVGAARITLGMLLTLKIATVVLLVLAQQRFITIKGLVALLLTSLLANIIVSFLHEFMPVLLASILDAIAAIVVGVLALIWALIKLISSIPAVFKVLRVDRQL